MTHKTGRYGRRFARSDPRGHWGTGVPASAGFMPEEPVILERSGHTFAQTSADDVDVSQVGVGGGHLFGADPPKPKPRPPVITIGELQDPFAAQSGGMNLSRAGAQRTRGARRSRSRKHRR